MIDIKVLRRLAQAATPGPWKMLPVGDGRQKFTVVNSEFLSILTVPDEGGATFGTVYDEADTRFIAAANPVTVIELLDRLEEAESDCLEQARLNGMGASREAALMAKLEVVGKENAKLREGFAQKVTSETILRDLNVGNGSINASFEGGAIRLFVDAFANQFVESGAANYLEMQFHSEATGPLVATLQRVNGKTSHQLRAEAEQERDALRAKVEAMEKQKPVAQVGVHKTGGNAGIAWSARPLNEFDSLPLLREGDELYLSPGAQPAQKAVAYLDLGAGGYTDIGTDLNDEQLALLPKGRHMLGIVGTYGVDGYVSSQPAPSISPVALRHVIQWLRNGCDPMKAADELELLAAAPGAKGEEK